MRGPCLSHNCLPDDPRLEAHIVLDELGPIQLGCLLAIYEHKVFCQGVLWNINSFDQWGVELGKNLALPIFDQLQGDDASNQDPATRHLIDHYRAINQS